MKDSSRHAQRIFIRTAILFLAAWCSFTSAAQPTERAQQLQEIVQLISQLKTTRDPNLFAALYDQLEQKELAFLSPTASDKAAYADFLRQSDTGMIRLMPKEDFDGVLYSSGGGAYYSFARRTHLFDFGSDLSLEGGAFQVGFAGADFGFLVSLGDVALGAVTADSAGVPYLATFAPPASEADARAQYQRSVEGFQVGGFAYRRSVSAIVNNTYAVRAVGYGSSDCLVVFRVLRKDTDGSLILLWKRLKWFPTPRLGGGSIAIVSAASYKRGVFAQESIVSAFIPNVSDATIVADQLPLPTTLAGIRVDVRENIGDGISNCCAVISASKIFSVSPNQINFEISNRYVVPHHGIIKVRKADGTVLTENVRFENVTPALFTANADGKGVPAAALLRVQSGTQTYEPISRFDSSLNKHVPTPIDVSDASGQAYLVLFGTGIRWRQALTSVNVTIGDVDAPVLFAGSQGATGLDQINVLLPPRLTGRGEVDLVLTVDGQVANTVRVNIK